MSQNADTLITETPTPAPPLVETSTPAAAPQTHAPQARLQRDLGNAAIARMLIQRKAEDSGPTTPATPPAPAPAVGPRIVDDKADAAPGQMRKTEFLARLRPALEGLGTGADQQHRKNDELAHVDAGLNNSPTP